jgi:hypothetical protein
MGHVLSVIGEKRRAIDAFRAYLRTREVFSHDLAIERLIEQLEQSLKER